MRDNDDQVDLAVRTLAPDVPPMSDTAFTAGRDRIFAAVSDVPRRRRPVGRWIAAAAVITVATVGVLNFGGPGLTPNAEAVAVLTDAADVTVHTTDIPVAPGQFRYVKEKRSRWMGVVLHGASSANCWFRYEQTEETWIPTDLNQDWLRRTTHTDPLETKSCTKEEAENAPFHTSTVTPWESRAKRGKFRDPDRVARPDSGGHPLEGQPAPEIPANIFHPTPELLAGLPRDPRKLFIVLRDSTCLADACAFVGAQDMLGTGQIPGELRAAVYRAMTRIAGMKVADRQANLDGQTGIAIRLTDPHRVRDMIVDPKTGDYIGARTVQDSPAGPLSESSSVTTGVANTLGAPPNQ
ncbi:CU044_5270 family protein [Actinocrispum wychmicini]|uniref:CU044_5270 family protein n=1 Tax=Actinocrispum wychmicini TaxID=1213861 RepID=A0A4R2J5Y9_9PSEU|nr:CU044_5270 family protein [Actinocrispum wychmicini]TCO52872.1 hypothetical protein EV192_11166 [Actinocrispum wychmicini]